MIKLSNQAVQDEAERARIDMAMAAQAKVDADKAAAKADADKAAAKADEAVKPMTPQEIQQHVVGRRERREVWRKEYLRVTNELLDCCPGLGPRFSMHELVESLGANGFLMTFTKSDILLPEPKLTPSEEAEINRADVALTVEVERQRALTKTRKEEVDQKAENDRLGTAAHAVLTSDDPASGRVDGDVSQPVSGRVDGDVVADRQKRRG